LYSLQQQGGLIATINNYSNTNITFAPIKTLRGHYLPTMVRFPSAASLLPLVVALAATSTTQAVVQTYDFVCHGSRVGTTFAPHESNKDWLGDFSSLVKTNDNSNGKGPSQQEEERVNNPFQCASLGFGLTPKHNSTILSMLESQQSIERLQDYYMRESRRALAIELWFTPPSTDEELQTAAPMFTIGQTSFPSSSTAGRASDCQGYDLRITQLDLSRLELSFQDEGTFRTCRTATFAMPALDPLLDETTLSQLIVVLSDRSLSIYINGQAIHENVRIDFTGYLWQWNSNHRVQLMSNHLPNSVVYPGSIHRLSLYDYALDSQVVPDLYLAGLHAIQDPAKPKTVPPVPTPVPQSPSTDHTPPTFRKTQSPTTTISTTVTPTVELTVTPPPMAIPGIPTLLATADETIIMPQGHTSPISMILEGQSSISPDYSDGWWSFRLEIVTAPKFGVLSIPDSNKLIQSGDVLDVEWWSAESSTDDIMEGLGLGALPTLWVTMAYALQSPNYFNIPRASVTGEDLGVIPEAFTYRFLVIDNLSTDVLASSAIVIQPFYVLRVHQPSTLSSNMTNLKWSSESASSLFGNRPAANFGKSIVLEYSEDCKVDRVRVDISAVNGTITLNAEHRSLADFEACKGRDFSTWQCLGTGKDDSSMTFLAYPSDVNIILSNLVYEGHYHTPDEVVIRVYDGQGGDCLTEEEHASFTDEGGRQFYSIYQERCHLSQLVFPLKALEGESLPEADQGKYFGWIISGAFVAFAGVYVAAKYKCNRYKAGKHANTVVPEEIGESHGSDCGATPRDQQKSLSDQSVADAPADCV